MTTIDTKQRSNREPIRLAKKPRPPLLDFALPAVAAGSGVMLGLAMTSIVDADSVIDYAKAGVLACSATAVSYGVNKLAIERGAPQAATGYWASGLTSVLSILLVGGGLFAGTYAGLTLKDTAELQLQEHGQELSAYVGNATGAAAAAARVDPVVRSIEADLQEKLACEIASSCVSGRGNGGNGTVARTIQEYAGRASAIGAQVSAGEAARGAIVSQLNDALTEYRTTLGDEERDIAVRRAALQGIDGRINQAIGRLREAVPVALLGAYAAELQGGVSVPGRPEAEARLNGILARHGQALSSVIGTIPALQEAASAFPKRTGVSDTFRYIAHFLPIAAIATVVELIFPLVLWLYSFWALHWIKYTESTARDAERAVAATIIPPAGSPALPNGAAQHPVRNGHAPDDGDFPPARN